MNLRSAPTGSFFQCVKAPSCKGTAPAAVHTMTPFEDDRARCMSEAEALAWCARLFNLPADGFSFLRFTHPMYSRLIREIQALRDREEEQYLCWCGAEEDGGEHTDACRRALVVFLHGGDITVNTVEEPVIYVDATFTWEGTHGDHAAHAARVAARNGGRWCHMWCDPGQEEALHRLAEQIGLKRDWCQTGPRRWPTHHYDLTPARRAAAIKAGAVERSMRDWYRAHPRLRDTDTGAQS